MAKFLKVTPAVENVYYEYVNLDNIAEIFPNEEIPDTDPVERGVALRHQNAGHETLIHTRETVDSFLKRVEALYRSHHVMECDEEDDPDPYRITDRGVWLPGETYATLDLVADPADVSKKLLAIKPSQSTSAGVLKNKDFWCPLQ